MWCNLSPCGHTHGRATCRSSSHISGFDSRRLRNANSINP
nr:MAG TPA: hypothetical protein [Caudoviricetes sp.]